jgi:hypothetical protein
MRSHPVVLAGVALVLAATVVRGWLLSRTWFYLDDLVQVNDSALFGLKPGYLVEPYMAHLMPAGKVLGWLVVEAGPMNYTMAVTELLVLFAGMGFAMLHLLVTLFGPRKAILALLAYFLFSPFLISAMSWWCVGLNHVPALLASCMALAAHVRYLRSGRRSDLVASVLWVLFGLAFAELALYLYLPMLVITVGYFATGRLGERIGYVWDHYRPAVLTHVLLGLIYVGVYLQTSWSPVPSTTAVDWSQWIGNATLSTFPLAAVGGPGHWHTAWAAQHEVVPAGSVRLLSYVVVISVLSLSAMTRDRAMRAWLIPGSQLALSVVLLAKARILLGPGIALDVRFFTPVALGVALALGLAFLPVVDSVESSTPRTEHWLLRTGPVTVAVSAYAVFAVISASNHPLLHLDRPPKQWYDAVQETLAAQDHPVDLVNATTPPWVMGPPEAYYERALVQLLGQVRLPDVVQDDFYVFSDDGELVRPDLKVARSAMAPAPDSCGYPVRTERSVPLDGPVLGFGWQLRIEYTAAADTSATISIGTGDTRVDRTVDLLSGEHQIEMKGDAEYEAVEISGVDPAADVCLSAVEVGTTQVPGRPVS